MKKQLKSFWFHYNKPESNRMGKPQITIHHSGACHIVDNVICDVKTMGRIRKQQPRWVISGKAKKFDVVDGVCNIF